MRRESKTFNKVARALDALGYEVKREGDLCSFEKDHVDHLIDVDEETETFSIVEFVMGLKGELTKEQFDTAMDVVKHFHNDYDGDWNEGKSYLSSPVYCLKDCDAMPTDQMEEIIQDFTEVFTFMCANACLVTDDSLFSSEAES